MAHMNAFAILAVISITVLSAYLLLALFGPILGYRIIRTNPPSNPERLCQTLEVLCDSQMQGDSRIEVLTNGATFYDAELEAIASARHSVNLVAYIFQKGDVASKFLEVLTARAREGVEVNL